LVNEGGDMGSHKVRAGLYKAQRGGRGTILATDACYPS
jgi:hypothetical protein